MRKLRILFLGLVLILATGCAAINRYEIAGDNRVFHLNQYRTGSLEDRGDRWIFSILE